MDAGDAASPDHGPVVVRRVIARVVDDGLLTAASVVIAVGIGQLFPDPAGPAPERELLMFSESFGGDTPVAAILLTGLLSTMLFLSYVGWASRREGRTIGRSLTGLRVVAAAGARATPSLLLGRELVRVALVCLSLAFAYAVALVLTTSIDALAPSQLDDNLQLIAATLKALVPIAVVIAGWIGSALVDPAGRAPHDRLARTQVVRARIAAAAPDRRSTPGA